MSDASVTETPPRSIFYLHGFASSPTSTKAAYLSERLHRHGLTLECPDFNQPDFATLTLTRMLEQLDRKIAKTRATLIGSSLGGTLAILAASSFGARVERLVLLAPALWTSAVESGVSQIGPPEGGPHVPTRSPDVGSGFSRIDPPDGPHKWIAPERIVEWRRLGQLPFFHYADNAQRMLNFTFYEDSFRYNPFDAKFLQPALIFQGTNDTSVDPRTVEDFALGRPNVTLSLLDDDHQLIKSLPRIWEGISAFLDIK
jgi:pimeloyl-ACP methyl ester carboxylesterase